MHALMLSPKQQRLQAHPVLAKLNSGVVCSAQWIQQILTVCNAHVLARAAGGEHTVRQLLSTTVCIAPHMTRLVFGLHMGMLQLR